MEKWKFFRGVLFVALFIWLLPGNIFAVRPHPEIVKKWKAEGTYNEKISFWRDYVKNHELDAINRNSLNLTDIKKRLLLAADESVDTINVPVILVEFPDHPADGQAVAGTVSNFDSILFSVGNVNPTGSMTDYFLENSYGRFFIKGKVFGWYTMPQTYSWYVDNDYGLTNSGQLAYDAIDSANVSINFDDYDYNNDGFCDGLIIIHAGLGAEQGGNDIWSHQGQVFNRPIFDGVKIFEYTMNPEEFSSTYDNKTVLSPIGVFCHEFSHILGLPYLYDINYTDSSSEGLGNWSLMASGNYNGDAKTPAHLDPWCKINLGFVNPVMVTANLKQAEIPRVEDHPVVYVLHPGNTLSEYWLVENRQKIGFDSTLPGAGLLIYHVDETATFNNSDPYRYHVALEQADGRNSLAFGGSSGDGDDPWPGSMNNCNFHDLSIPDSRTNIVEDITEIGVWNITESAEIIYADLDISFSRPYVILDGADSVRIVDSIIGNSNGLIEQGETIELYIKLKNLMLSTGHGCVTLSVSDPQISILQNTICLSDIFERNLPVNNDANPFIFTVPSDFKTKDVTFTLTLSLDSALTAGTGLYKDTIEFTETVGKPDFLVINSGHSKILNSETVYKTTFNRLNWSVRIWDRSRSFPDTTFLENFNTVFWITDTSSTNVFNADDLLALKKFLDKGNNLFIASPCGLNELVTLDSAFVTDYLHLSRLSSSGSSLTLYGVAGDPLGNDLRFYLDTSLGFNGVHKLLAPVNSGQTVFELDSSMGGGTVGISYSGTYKTIFITFPIETIVDDQTPEYDTKTALLSRTIQFMNGDITGIDDENPEISIPESFTLYQNYPNPFNPSTVIKYVLTKQNSAGNCPVRTRLTIYNLLGREIIVLVDEIQAAGTYEVPWNATDRDGNAVATGVYFYKLERGDLNETRKMVLLK